MPLPILRFYIRQAQTQLRLSVLRWPHLKPLSSQHLPQTHLFRLLDRPLPAPQPLAISLAEALRH